VSAAPSSQAADAIPTLTAANEPTTNRVRE
jgi:hypothetical protein